MLHDFLIQMLHAAHIQVDNINSSELVIPGNLPGYLQNVFYDGQFMHRFSKFSELLPPWVVPAAGDRLLLSQEPLRRDAFVSLSLFVQHFFRIHDFS